jgi:DNA-binding CsgD family transcriptional regulator
VSAEPSKSNRAGLGLLLVALTVIASFWACQGWVAVAHDWLAIKGPQAYLLFAMFEGVVIALILIATRTRLAGDSAAVMWAGVWFLTSLAVAVQVVHALDTTKPQSALIYGTATLVVVLLWQVKTRQANKVKLRELGLVPVPSVNLGVWFWLRFTRWAWRAQTIARWEGIADPATAVQRAQAVYPAGDMPWDKAHAKQAAKQSKERAPLSGSVTESTSPEAVTEPDVHPDTTPVTEEPAAADTEPATTSQPEPDNRTTARRTPNRPRTRTAKRSANRTTGQDIARLIKRTPEATQADIAKQLKISERTVRRYMKSDPKPAAKVTPIHQEAAQ